MTEPKSAANPLFLKDEELRAGFELLFSAMRSLGDAIAAELSAAGIGSQHRLPLYLIGSGAGTTPGDLTEKLGLPKQSISRLVAELVDRGLVDSRRSIGDGRRRTLTLTDTGAALDTRLWRLEHDRLADAYRAAGAEAVEGFKQVVHAVGAGQPKQRGRRTAPVGGDVLRR